MMALMIMVMCNDDNAYDDDDDYGDDVAEILMMNSGRSSGRESC